MTSYEDARSYVLGIPKFAGKNTLEDTKTLLDRVYTEGSAKIVHIAGTNGKGSTASYLASIFQSAGYRTALFTSPHLVSVRERISVNRKMISPESFAEHFDRIKRLAGEAGEEHHPSFFEFLFLMAMSFFAQEKAEVIVLETGLGGRLDATNCLLRKDLCVITHIDYDHTEYLGDTIEKIAGEKAGILREGVPVVWFDEPEEASGVIRARAEELNCNCYSIHPEDISLLNVNKESIDFSLSCEYYSNVTLTITGIASYQTKNASLAYVAARVFFGADADEDVIRKGLLEAFWPGRFEVTGKGVILDGAHNPDGIRAFLDAVSHHPCSGRRLLVFGAADDKNVKEEAKLILESGLFDRIFLTPIQSSRSMRTEKLKAFFAAAKAGTVEAGSSDGAGALLRALSEKKENDRIYVAGSLYLVGEIRAAGDLKR